MRDDHGPSPVGGLELLIDVAQMRSTVIGQTWCLRATSATVWSAERTALSAAPRRQIDEQAGGTQVCQPAAGRSASAFLTAPIYLIARGTGRAERSFRESREDQAQTNEDIRSVAGTSAGPTAESGSAKTLLDAGTITPAGFDALKSRTLSGSSHPQQLVPRPAARPTLSSAEPRRLSATKSQAGFP